MALNFLNNGIFAGEVTISTIPAVGSDTDKFLMSNSGVISFATGAEVLSFIGGAPASGGAYLELAGNSAADPMTGNIVMSNGNRLMWTADDPSGALTIHSNASNSFIQHTGTGYFQISNDCTGGIQTEMLLTNYARNQPIRFQADNGNPATTGADACQVRDYFFLDGASATYASGASTAVYTVFPDLSYIALGTGKDLQIYHKNNNSYINETGGGSLILATSSVNRLEIDSAGAIQFNAYDSTNNVGTPTYILGTDASGNVVKVLGSNIPGSGSGTVTGITEGPGITVTASATSPTVAVDYIGADSLVMEAADAVPDLDDYIIFGADSSGGGDTNKIQFTDVNLSLFNNDSGFTSNAGTVTSVGSGAGLTGGPFTVSGNIAVDYLGTDSIIKAAPTLSTAVALTDFLLVAGSNGNVYETTFSNLPLDNYNRWRVQANTGLVYNVTSDTNVDFIGGTNISTSTGTQAGGLTVTINNDLTNNTQLTNGAGYITASSTNTLTNKSGLISQWTNDSSYITAASLPTVNNATITIQAGTNLTTGGAFTTNQGVNETITINMATGGVGAGTYGSTSDSTKIDSITVDAYGRVTAVATGATGQVNTVSDDGGSTINVSGSATSRTVSAVTAAVSSGSNALATGAQIQTAINTATTGVLSYQGTWNASTNSPALASGVGTPGYYYIVSTAGSTNLDGITDWAVGDWAVFSDLATDAWQKIDNTQVGNVTGSGASGRVAYWNSTSNITSSANMTFNGANLGVSGIMSASGGNSTEWNDAYDNKITTFANSGTSTVTLTLTQQDGGTLSTSFSVPQGTVTGGPYLPLAGGTMSGNIAMGDNNITGLSQLAFTDNIRFDDLGADNYLRLTYGDAGPGGLQIYDGDNTLQGYLYADGQATSSFGLLDGTGSWAVKCLENQYVELRYDDSVKLRTSTTGITVTGDIQIDSALLSNQENTDVDTGTETVANVAIATYTAAFFDFVIKKTTNVRSGTVYACHDGTNVEFTETSTQDLGNTSDVTLSVDISGGNMRLLATTTSNDWSVKSLIRAI